MEKDNFEANIKNLEEIVSALESNELELEASIKKFEEGVKIYKACKKQLVSVEKKITKLTDELKEEDLS